MGRRGGMRGRPGLFFVAVFVIFLVIFYWSWRSMSDAKIKPDPRKIDILQRKNAFNNKRISEESQVLRQNNPKYSVQNAESFLERAADRDQDYYLKDSGPTEAAGGSQPNVSAMKKEDREIDNSKKSNPDPVSEQEKVVSDTKIANSPMYYKVPNENILKTVESMERFVHLDLKGAALKMDYLRSFIPLLPTLGATGVLMEYEDMFPFSGMLQNVSAVNSYTKENIKELLELFAKNQLKVMPLIQTFGHMEYVLKSVFNDLRESSQTPQVIDVTSNRSYAVISEMVKQISEAHPDITYIHIGCDEVYELGRGESAWVMQNQKLSKRQMFLQHVRKVANIVRNNKKVPVMWDDELRGTDIDDIKAYDIPSLVEIMVWQYSPDVMAKINSTVWNKYAQIFKSVWIASSFKGATGSRQFFTEPQYHVRNHLSWLEVIAAHQHHLGFKGVALTGWQRFDHFATLCELLPVAIPSLALCLATVKNAGFTKEIHKSTSDIFRCDLPIEMTFPKFDKESRSAFVRQDCRFPGSELYFAMQMFHGFTQIQTQHRIDGWLSDYQIAHGFSNPGQLKILLKAIEEQSTGYNRAQHVLQRNLDKIYSEDTVDEWLEENVMERKRRNQEIKKKILSLLKPKTWARRPLPHVQVFPSDSGEFRYINLADGVKETQQKDPQGYRKPLPPQVNSLSQTQRPNMLEKISERYVNSQQNQPRSRNQQDSVKMTVRPRYLANNNGRGPNPQNAVGFQNKKEGSYDSHQGFERVRESALDNNRLPNQPVNRGGKESLLHTKLGQQDYMEKDTKYKQDLGKNDYRAYGRRNTTEEKDAYANKKDVHQFDIVGNKSVMTQIDEEDKLRRSKYLEEGKQTGLLNSLTTGDAPAGKVIPEDNSDDATEKKTQDKPALNAPLDKNEFDELFRRKNDHHPRMEIFAGNKDFKDPDMDKYEHSLLKERRSGDRQQKSFQIN